jgi:hypothetical protein
MKCTLSSLEKEGYEGCDVNLAVALYEYGLIWKLYRRKTKKGFAKGEYRFIYGVGVNFSGNYNLFDWAGNVHETTNPEQEWNWVDWRGVASFVGCPVEELLRRSIPSIVDSLVAYYGAGNVFGGGCHPFTIGHAN